jgi:hypothetical protein
LSDYRPELEVSPELKSDGIQLYQELIGVIQWAVELGRVDILLEASLMLTHMALPREGHLQRLHRMFGYLKLYPKRKIAFDFQHPYISEKCSRSMTGTTFTAMQRKRYQETCQSHEVTQCQRIVIWHSKRQNTVEASTFGSEFQTMKNAVELKEALRHKLRMFGVPIHSATNIFCDNEAVYKNTTMPWDSTLVSPHWWVVHY